VPTALATSRQYARDSLSAGSRLARSAVQPIPGPTYFAPGTYSPGAAAVKLAHALFAYGSQKSAREQQAAAAEAAAYESELRLADLERKADPNYMTRYQTEMIDLARAREERLGTPSAPQATPRAPVWLTEGDARYLGLGGAGEYDPETARAALNRIRETRLGEQAKVAADVAKNRSRSAQRYTKAQAELRQYDFERGRVADAAEESARREVSKLIAELQNKSTSRSRAAAIKRTLGLPVNFTERVSTIPADVYGNAVAVARRQAEARYDAEINEARKRALQVIQNEAGTLMGMEDDPVMQAIRRALEDPGLEE
jgi:hypothetical protein